VIDLTKESLDARMLLYNSVLVDNDVDAARMLARNDLFFLLVIVLNRKDVAREWVMARCDEVQANPDGFLDLWAREHYKSTIITFAKTIQDVLIDPEVTIGIFSHNRPAAKKFLSQIKIEFENNKYLKSIFPDVLYRDPAVDSPRWSMDNGIVVRRNGNPKEGTIEAWGLVDGQPTGSHFKKQIYDDVVTRESVTTPEQIETTTKAFQLSLNLGQDGGIRRITGTFYHQLDTYNELIKRGVPVRIYPATDDGTVDGDPVLISQKSLDDKLALMGEYVFSCQMLLNPVAVSNQGFKKDWFIQHTNTVNPEVLNRYILVDPSGSKKKKSGDYTVQWVVGTASDGNYYILDGVRDKMNLTERTKSLFDLVRKWRPISVGYEEYGLQADIEHIRYVMEQDNYRFSIIPYGGNVPKPDRIAGLVPLFSGSKIWFPPKIIFLGADGKTHDAVAEFVADEFAMYPVSSHDDMLDCLARVLDKSMGISFPTITQDLPFAITGGGNSRFRANDNYDYLRGEPIKRAG